MNDMHGYRNPRWISEGKSESSSAFEKGRKYAAKKKISMDELENFKPTRDADGHWFIRCRKGDIYPNGLIKEYDFDSEKEAKEFVKGAKKGASSGKTLNEMAISDRLNLESHFEHILHDVPGYLMDAIKKLPKKEGAATWMLNGPYTEEFGIYTDQNGELAGFRMNFIKK